MSLLERLRSSSPAVRYGAGYAPWDDFWFQKPSASAGLPGYPLSAESALQLDMVWACVNAVSGDLASLPLILYRRLQNGGKERATDHPLYFKLRAQANGWQTAYEIERMAMTHLMLRGNYYEWLQLNGRMDVAKRIPLHPDKVRVVQRSDGLLEYVHTPELASHPRPFQQWEIHHRRGLTLDGVTGVSVIEYQARTLATATAGHQYAGQFYNVGMAPPFAVVHKEALGEEGLKNLRDSIREHTAGASKAGAPLVLEEDLRIEMLGIKPQDAQLLESRGYSDEQIARMFGVPPYRVGINKAGTVSYASVELSNQAYVSYCLRGWAVNNEQAIWRDMLGDREQADYVPEYLLEGFLRADSAGRASFYKSGIENRWLTPNEARERESLNPLPGGDQFPELPKTRRREHDDEEDTRDPRGRPVGRAALIVEEACARVVQKELAAASKAAQKFANDSPGWQAWCREFYDGHASFVGTVLKLRSDAARRYAAKQGAELAAGGMAATKDWESRAVAELAALALGEAA